MIRFPPNLDAAGFLRNYWQQKPLLIRQGLPDFRDPLEPDELAGLALEPEVESRLVAAPGDNGPWQLSRGPFTEEDFRSPPATPWTLLVQGVDLWLPEAGQLLAEFDFLPPWRLDDIMVSYACDGGGVGPHFDHYDVFLVQGLGKRRWQVGPLCNDDAPVLADAPLKILADFRPEAEYILEPGDILYLPPGISHCGTAAGDCLTWSVGFRAPSAAEMLSDLATELVSRDSSPHYRDPPLTPAMADGRISRPFIHQIRELLAKVLDDEQLLTEWFAAYMTAPKYPELTTEDTPPRRAVVPGNPPRVFENGVELIPDSTDRPG